LWLSRAKFADPAETRLPRRRGCQQDADPIMWLNVAQLSPLREIAELWESIARSCQILMVHEEAQIERSALGS